MGMLDTIQTERTHAPRRVMLYGTHGIGKSTFAAMADKPIFIQTEEGLGEIECAKFPLSTTYENVMDALRELYAEDHEYKTLIIDSVDWLERLIWTQTCIERNVETMEDVGFAKAYTFALRHWRDVLTALGFLRDKKGMTIVLLAHAVVEKFENPDTEAYQRFTPRLHKHANAIVQEWCDEVLFAKYKVFTKAKEEGFNKKRVQGVGTGERVILTTERPTHLAKNRLNMPDEIALDWQAYKSFWNTEEGI